MTAKQGLHSIKVFSAPHELRGDTVEQLTPADPRNITDHTVSCSVKWERMLGRGDRMASVSCSFTSPVILGIYFSLFVIFIAALLLLLLLLLHLLNHSYLNPWIFSLSPFQFTSFILLQQRSQEVPLVAGWGWTMTLFQKADFFFFPHSITQQSVLAQICLLPLICWLFPMYTKLTFFNLFSKHKLFWGFFPHVYQWIHRKKTPNFSVILK